MAYIFTHCDVEYDRHRIRPTQNTTDTEYDGYKRSDGRREPIPVQLEYEIDLETQDGCCRARVVLEDACIFRVISAVPLMPKQHVTIRHLNKEMLAEVIDVTTSTSGYRGTLHVQDICVHR
ncbi:MAG: hypothetical protein ACI9G1_003462 [Pirellulaceae bacterium]